MSAHSGVSGGALCSTTMSEANKTNSKQVAAISLKVALRRYADWVGSLESVMPSRLSAAHQDIRLILDLRDQQYHPLARHIDDLILGHQRLGEAMGGGAPYTNCRSSGEIGRLAQAANQASVVNRLLSMVDRHLPASPAPRAGVLAGREINAHLQEQSLPSRNDLSSAA